MDAFVRAAVSGRRNRAEALVAADPAIADDAWAALALGRGWDGDPNEAGGPLGWAPLVYACHSCFDTTRVGRELLGRGADPNGSFVNEYGRMSALYGAAGVKHDPELTRALLEAGADPDDGESLYHATESESPECVRILLEHGAEPNGTNALAHALDEERLEHVRLLLEHGADPDEGAVVAHAVRRGRDAETIELLAAHGADLDRPGGETWRGDVPLRTPYQHAVLRGKTELAEALARLGASTKLDPADEAVAAIARGERPERPLPEPLDPDAQEVLILTALRGGLDRVVEAVGPSFSGVVGGSPEGTVLHHACWVGATDLVERLLALGADPAAPSRADFESPLDWAVHASQYHGLSGRDYVGVAERLVAAGAPPVARHPEAAEGPLADWLLEQEHRIAE